MKATDLMVGDWACVYSNDRTETHPFRVNEIVERGVYDSHKGFVEEKDIEPIPLTKEILKKNGWKRDNDEKAYMVNYDSGQDNMNCWCMWSIKEHNLEVQTQSSDLSNYNLCVRRVVIPCDYVHELQHALKLCGIEKKEIVL